MGVETVAAGARRSNTTANILFGISTRLVTVIKKYHEQRPAPGRNVILVRHVSNPGTRKRRPPRAVLILTLIPSACYNVEHLGGRAWSEIISNLT